MHTTNGSIAQRPTIRRHQECASSTGHGSPRHCFCGCHCRGSRGAFMIKDVVALVDGSAGDGVPLEHAERIARLFEANLTALYLNVLPDVLISGQSTLSPIAIDQVMATSKRVGAAAATRLSARLQGAGVPAELRHIDTADSELWNLVSNASRAADLFVARHPGAGGVRPQWRLVAEAALFGSARGIYFAECPSGPEPMLRSVVVAWDSSHSASRAL